MQQAEQGKGGKDEGVNGHLNIGNFSCDTHWDGKCFSFAKAHMHV